MSVLMDMNMEIIHIYMGEDCSEEEQNQLSDTEYASTMKRDRKDSGLDFARH